MRGTEISSAACDAEIPAERDGAAGIPGGGELGGADGIGVGSVCAAESGGAPDRTRQWRPGEFHVVYALIDGRDGSTFYIGYTHQRPKARLWGHCHDRKGAAYQRIQEIRQSAPVTMRVLSRYRCASEALYEEHRLINLPPGLVNRHRTGTWSDDVLPDNDASVTVEPDGDFLEHQHAYGDEC